MFSLHAIWICIVKRSPWIIACVWTLSLADAHASAADLLNAVIENVERNEALYGNIEIIIRSVYEADGRDKGGNGWNVVQYREKRTRHVTQDAKFFVSLEGTQRTEKGAMPLHQVRAFDGQTTRLAFQDAIGNVISGRADDENLIRPHMLLAELSDALVPLSTYLKGHDAIMADPNAAWEPTATLEITYEGQEAFQGLRCHKVWLTALVNQVPHSRYEALLAEERNYFPIRVLAFTFRFSETIPVGESVVDEWREIGPGIWFPFAIRDTAYDKAAVQAKGAQIPIWWEAKTVETAMLNPHYDVAFFRDVEFPKGAAVYHVEGDKITKSYRVGAPQAESGPKAGGSRYRWMACANIAALGLFGAVFLVRRLRGRAGREPGAS